MQLLRDLCVVRPVVVAEGAFVSKAPCDGAQGPGGHDPGVGLMGVRSRAALAHTDAVHRIVALGRRNLRTQGRVRRRRPSVQ